MDKKVSLWTRWHAKQVVDAKGARDYSQMNCKLSVILIDLYIYINISYRKMESV